MAIDGTTPSYDYGSPTCDSNDVTHSTVMISQACSNSLETRTKQKELLHFDHNLSTDKLTRYYIYPRIHISSISWLGFLWLSISSTRQNELPYAGTCLSQCTTETRVPHINKPWLHESHKMTTHDTIQICFKCFTSKWRQNVFFIDSHFKLVWSVWWILLGKTIVELQSSKLFSLNPPTHLRVTWTRFACTRNYIYWNIFLLTWFIHCLCLLMNVSNIWWR